MDQEHANVKGLMSQIAPCLWDVDPISLAIVDKRKIHIESLVATEDDNQVFHQILISGNSDLNAKDNYSKNYAFFRQKCDSYAENHPLEWEHLCVLILNRCIILPIECDTPETALTIFSTLNDRGLPLSDSDIFKAQIYRLLPLNERKLFTDQWKELNEICAKSQLTADDIFRYYTHVIRARENDRSKEIGLRKFYAQNNYCRLTNKSLMLELIDLAKFWHSTVKDIAEYDGIQLSTEARKYLHCLNCYPNEYWKYSTSVFFLKNKGNIHFDEKFIALLKQTIAFLFSKFISYPTVNAIKGDIYDACINITSENNQIFVSKTNKELLKKHFEEHKNSKLSRGLLLLNAYLHPSQHDGIPNDFEIEHIFPKSWQNTNYNGWNREDADSYLDRLGNKIVIEKKLNIQAGNGYFEKKKSSYLKSNIACVKDLGNYTKPNWLQSDIVARGKNVTLTILNFFESELNLPSNL